MRTSSAAGGRALYRIGCGCSYLRSKAVSGVEEDDDYACGAWMDFCAVVRDAYDPRASKGIKLSDLMRLAYEDGETRPEIYP